LPPGQNSHGAADGFLLSDVRADQLVTGIRTETTGGALLASAVTQRLVSGFAERPPGVVVPPGLRDLADARTSSSSSWPRAAGQ
jgi:hypothetical protein